MTTCTILRIAALLGATSVVPGGASLSFAQEHGDEPESEVAWVFGQQHDPIDCSTAASQKKAGDALYGTVRADRMSVRYSRCVWNGEHDDGVITLSSPDIFCTIGNVPGIPAAPIDLQFFVDIASRQHQVVKVIASESMTVEGRTWQMQSLEALSVAEGEADAVLHQLFLASPHAHGTLFATCTGVKDAMIQRDAELRRLTSIIRLDD